MLKIKFHPAFWIFAFVLTLQGAYILLIIAVISAVLHELGHARMAYNKGYTLESIVIMPYGAVLFGGEKLQKKDAFLISLAGPAVSLSICIATVAMWWIFPITYNFTKEILYVNLSIFIFNLLPAYPLDGGRMIVALAKKPLKALKALRILGIVISCLMLAVFVYSAFYTINYSFGLLAVMMYISATEGTAKEGYRHIAASAPFIKDYSYPIKYESYIISEQLMLIELLKLIKCNHVCVFNIVDGNNKTVAQLSENDIAQFCLNNSLRTKITTLLNF